MDFFEQICQVLAENGKKFPGRLTDNEDVKQFFSPVEKKIETPAVVQSHSNEPQITANVKNTTPQNALEQLCSSLNNCSR